ncbi:unnamed protein product [Mytilus coruscus]|uniref:Tyr recombinase domain-containing protein n=1 Tax=Mytilus coruscus TaxID=42192 RepID=A0A6J8A4S5_MYTCO|nr:unnamed protein product [Mytilus coruscus]
MQISTSNAQGPSTSTEDLAINEESVMPVHYSQNINEQGTFQKFESNVNYVHDIPSINNDLVKSHVCPVHLLRTYFNARSKSIGPAFILFCGNYVTRYQFNAVLKKVLNVADILLANFQSHSFRIGAASQSSKMGFSDDEIQNFGRWESKAYKAYIRIPTLRLASQI